jgi:hypothetical protein
MKSRSVIKQAIADNVDVHVVLRNVYGPLNNSKMILTPLPTLTECLGIVGMMRASRIID